MTRHPYRRVILTALVLASATLPARAALPSAVVADEDACGALQTVVDAAGHVTCTHGADPAPPGIDASVPRPLESSEPVFTTSEGTGAPAVQCYGDGASGKRVQAMYVRPSDHPDRAGQVVPLIRQWAADVDNVFSASASASGGTRHVRFVTNPDCTLNVVVATVPPTGDDNIASTMAELKAQGYSRSDRKYLVWMDSTVLCGIANYYIDDRSDAGNLNNGAVSAGGLIARVDNGCWGLASRGQSVEAHELTHTLGGVQPTAPHATQLGHCKDDADRMCYDDGSPGYAVQNRCPPEHEALLDCGYDDYFSAAPSSGTYLTTHWNTARSEFLAAAAPPPPPNGVVTRLAGEDRVATSLVSSKNMHAKPQSATAAVLANARTYADALTGVPLTARKGGPLLLTDAHALDPRVATELQRVLRPESTVYLLGGTAALSDKVADAIKALGFPVVRYGGATRYETATIIASKGLGNPNTVFEVTGQSFADALAGGAAAAEIDGAVLLTEGTSQSVDTARYLAMHPTSKRYALGGPAASADPTAQRLVGADRFETAVLVAKAFFSDPTMIGVASGLKFPDALAGGANIAAHSGPMLLATPYAPLPAALVDYVRAVSIDHALLYGGTTALTDQVATGIARLAE